MAISIFKPKDFIVIYTKISHFELIKHQQLATAPAAGLWPCDQFLNLEVVSRSK